jgi:hypothetical protein
MSCATILDRQKTGEREAMLKRIRELDAEIAQHERNLREGKSKPRQLPTTISYSASLCWRKGIKYARCH